MQVKFPQAHEPEEDTYCRLFFSVVFFTERRVKLLLRVLREATIKGREFVTFRYDQEKFSIKVVKNLVLRVFLSASYLKIAYLWKNKNMLRRDL